MAAVKKFKLLILIGSILHFSASPSSAATIAWDNSGLSGVLDRGVKINIEDFRDEKLVELCRLALRDGADRLLIKLTIVPEQERSIELHQIGERPFESWLKTSLPPAS